MKLNLGCGIHLKKGFTNVDIINEADLIKGAKTKKGVWKKTVIEKGAKYVQADIHELPFKDNSATLVEIFSVIEHIPFREVIPVLKEIYRVLKPKGKLVLQTDDFDGLILDWARMRMKKSGVEEYQSIMETIYGNQTHGGEFHKCCMTPDFLNWCLSQAGFKNGTITRLAKNNPVKKFGLGDKIKKDMFYRNDQIVAEVVK